MTDTAENQEPTLREQIEKSAADVAAANEEIVKASPEKPGNPAATGAEKPVERDDNGRFAANVEKPAQPPVVKKPPEFWPSERKERFAKLAPEVQDLMLEREAEVEKGFTKMDEERSFGKGMKEVIAPYIATIQAEGGTPQAAVKDLLNTAYILRTGSPHQKAAIVAQVIRQYGVNPALLGGAQQSGGQQPPQTINRDEIVREIKQDLQTQQMNDRIAGELKAFTDNAKNVHFSNPAVKGKMSSLLGTGEAKDYQDAYDQAIWLVPELRPALIAAHTTPPSQQQNTDVQAKKRAGLSVSGSPGAVIPNSGNKNQTIREALEASYNALTH